jgi:hypothetical protein
MIHAPVPEIGYVDVPQSLVAIEPRLTHMAVGISHGSVWIPDCSDREVLQHFSNPENRGRFARLAVLYGLVTASDHQFIYRKAPPNLVFSVDHGHFFPNAGDWQVVHLQNAPPAAPDNNITIGCQLTQNEIDDARSALRVITEEQIAEAVSGPMDHWGVSVDEKIAVAIFLDMKRQDLLAGLP